MLAAHVLDLSRTAGTDIYQKVETRSNPGQTHICR
jgi:hypothetical protein